MEQQQQQQQQQQGPFDAQRFFNPNLPSNPNPNLPYPPPSTAASYPPPTVTGAGVPYSYPQPPLFHHQYAPQYENSNPNPNPSNPNMQHQRSVPYPTPSLQPPANHGARLMALLSAPMATSVENANMVPSMMTSALVSAGGVGGTGPMRMASSKMPKGRHLVGEKVAYDIDVRLGGEVQPQLEVTPITKYGSDPELLVGRQIADVDLLAGASIDGRVFVWKITEGKDEDDKPQITGNIVIALQIEVE
nr:hypothetical protein [Tanacetum cinerariifolium]